MSEVCHAVQNEHATANGVIVSVEVAKSMNLGVDEPAPPDAATNKTFKKKQRGAKRSYTYVDYDQKVDDEEVVQRAVELSWSGATTSPEASSHFSASRHCVTYEDIAVPQDTCLQTADKHFTNGCQQQQQSALESNKLCGSHSVANMGHNHLHSLYAVQSLTAPNPNDATHQLFDYVDPNVTASEKQAIFKNPVTTLSTDLVGKQGRKPLSKSQQRKREKAQKYRELQRQKEEKAKERQQNVAKKPRTTCRFFLNGNCNKGSNCTYSHDCLVPKKLEVCKFYIMGVCMKGSACVYYHDDWPCKFYHKFNFCTNGDSCKFSHAELTDDTRQILEKLDALPPSGARLSADSKLGKSTGSGSLQPVSKPVQDTTPLAASQNTVMHQLGLPDECNDAATAAAVAAAELLAASLPPKTVKRRPRTVLDKTKQQQVVTSDSATNSQMRPPTWNSHQWPPTATVGVPGSNGQLWPPTWSVPGIMIGNGEPSGHTYQPLTTATGAVYALKPVDINKPSDGTLPKYIDIDDSRWSRDPRVRKYIGIDDATHTNLLSMSYETQYSCRSADMSLLNEPIEQPMKVIDWETDCCSDRSIETTDTKPATDSIDSQLAMLPNFGHLSALTQSTETDTKPTTDSWLPVSAGVNTKTCGSGVNSVSVARHIRCQSAAALLSRPKSSSVAQTKVTYKQHSTDI